MFLATINSYIKNISQYWVSILFLSLLISMYFILKFDTFEIYNTFSAKDHSRRIFWGISVIFLILSMANSYMNSLMLVRNNLLISRIKLRSFLISLFLISISMTYSVSFSTDAGKSILQVLSTRADVNIILITDVMNIFAIQTILLMVFSVSTLSRTHILYIDEEMIRKNTTDIYRSFYASTILLTAGIIEIYCLFNWSALFSCSDEYLGITRSTIMSVSGLFFTFILITIYVPVFIKRNGQISTYLNTKNFLSKKELEDWYAINHLEQTAGGKPLDLLALALPILTGLISNFLVKII